MTQEELDQLKAARDLISDPAKWTQRYFARDVQGNPVNARMNEAVCFCALGAVERICGFQWEYTTIGKILDARCQTLHNTCTSTFNDKHSHDEVLALFDDVIAEMQT